MKKKLLFISLAVIIALGIIPFKTFGAESLSSKMRGKILLQVESHGEAWYVNPKDGKRYYMANGSEAYNIMRTLGVGITNSDLDKIKANKTNAKKQSGKILLQVQSHGEAYYIDSNGNVNYLKDGDAAYQIMRKLGLGVKTSDLNKIELSDKDKSLSSSVALYQVLEVVDGDTIKVNLNGATTTIRLIGMDTPETLDPRKVVQCFGKEASAKAKELLFGKMVRLENDSTTEELDKYSRPLKYVFLEDGTFYNDKMIRDGYAHEYTYNKPYKYQAQFKEAQKEASTNLRGLWATDTCNGDTTKAADSSSESSTASSTVTVSTNKYYTSSYKTSSYYYPESCDGWKSLNSSYLKSFDSLSALLESFPSRTLSPSCN
ncbi:MAG: thermonuclease family protein [Tepidanaerobacteraceae bacterium]|nr:thermonuclease family protein [Tepidanaerobacteraceae bacterium]